MFPGYEAIDLAADNHRPPPRIRGFFNDICRHAMTFMTFIGACLRSFFVKYGIILIIVVRAAYYYYSWITTIFNEVKRDYEILRRDLKEIKVFMEEFKFILSPIADGKEEAKYIMRKFEDLEHQFNRTDFALDQKLMIQKMEDFKADISYQFNRAYRVPEQNLKAEGKLLIQKVEELKIDMSHQFNRTYIVLQQNLKEEGNLLVQKMEDFKTDIHLILQQNLKEEGNLLVQKMENLKTDVRLVLDQKVSGLIENMCSAVWNTSSSKYWPFQRHVPTQRPSTVVHPVPSARTLDTERTSTIASEATDNTEQEGDLK